MAYDLLATHSAARAGACGTKILVALPWFLGLLVPAGCGRDDVNVGGTGGAGKGGASGRNDGAVVSDATGTGTPDARLPTGGAPAGGSLGTGGLLGTGGQIATGAMPGAGGLAGSGGMLDAGGAAGSGGLLDAGGAAGKGGALGTGGATASGGIQSLDGGLVVVKLDAAPVPDAPSGTGGLFGGGAGGTRADVSTGGDLPGEAAARDAGDAGDAALAVCPAPAPNGHHIVHFRYVWASQRTFTYFPEPAFMPTSIELEVAGSSVTCLREMDRPWFACPVPDSHFRASATWRAVDKTRSPEWNTVKPWPLPAEPKEYWIRWYYGKPDIPREIEPPNFMVFDYNPDTSHGNWAATGNWNDDQCPSTPPANPAPVGFDFGGWFPYQSTAHRYPFGGSLAYVYTDVPAVQDAFDAFVFERYQLWKRNWVKYDDDACGAGTARVRSDVPEGTVSEGQGYGMAITAAIGDKELFDKLWRFVRHFRSQARYCGLMGWLWRSPADCQPLDSFASGASSSGSAFDGDVDIGIGLVFAARQWPEYLDAATDWLSRMECEINTKYGDGYNYPTAGDSWDKASCTAEKCDYAEKTNSTVFIDYYPPGYFRVFGDFLAATLGGEAKAANGQTHRDFWYKTAATVWELVERCYAQPGVHPGLMGNQGHVDKPCSSGGGEPYEWGRALWRLAIDAAWFGNDADLPENMPGSSAYGDGKSRIQTKMDFIQRFYTSFHQNNLPAPNANRFSTICHQLGTDGTVSNCDPAYGHNSYTVNLALSPYVTLFDDGGNTTTDIRKEAIEESISTTVQNTHYFEESLGVYSLLFLTGNFPNPMTVPERP